MIGIISVSDFDENMELDKWYSSMIWCPSQCYMHKQRDGVDYILYLRWRWDDPWQAHIVKNAWNENSMNSRAAEWSPDLFDANGIHFKEDEYERAKNKLMELFEEASQDKRTPGLGAFKDAAELEGLTIKPKERKR
jgi:hypothetical protein